MRPLLPLLILAAATGAIAQQPKKDPAVEQGLRQIVANVETERRQIMQLLADYEKAFRARDLDGIMKLYAPNIVAYDIAPPLKYEGAAAYRKAWEGFFAAYEGPIEMEIRDMQFQFSGTLAVTHNLERFAGKLKGGARSEIWVRVTDVYQKIGGKWLIVHEHVSVPTDFETGKAALDLKP